jgi:hypothetical protein
MTSARICRRLIYLLAIWSSVASALANELPDVSGSLALELNHKTTDRKPSGDRRNDLYGFAEADVLFRLNQHVSMRAVATFEPLTDPHPLADRVFQNEDVRWKDVYVQYDDGVMGFRGGRITANFGRAWYAAPGLDATTLAEGYAIWDRMGISTWYRLKTIGLGTTTLGATLFSMDTSPLSASWRNTRKRRTPEQGGLSNTDAPSSIAVSLDGSDIAALPGFTWQLAALEQKVDFRIDSAGQRSDHVADEKGVTAGIQQILRLADRLESTTLVEASYLKDKGGIPAASGHYLTVGETLRFGQYHVQAAYTVRWLDNASAEPARDSLLALTAGRKFTDHLSLDARWRKTRISAATEDDFRLRLRYVIAF